MRRAVLPPIIRARFESNGKIVASYDAADDFSRSLDDCYAAIRVRVAAGGKAWEPK
jgi:hypothetical protein